MYRVPGPNSLWHIDGNHKLIIRWRFVIHGGVDGFSRVIVFLHCSTNNRSETVFGLFHGATKVFGVPSRVRSDKGGENVRVCQFMISHRGLNRGSHIAGASVHNQRIERMWRDVFQCVSSTYYTLFCTMETTGILDPTNEVDLFVLQYVFLPKINQALHEFASAWNHHPLRTERNWSPKKIWLNGVLNPQCSTQTAVRDIVEGVPLEGIDNFGIDFGGPIPEERSADTVHVPDTILPPGVDLDSFEAQLGPLVVNNEENPVDLYLYGKGLLHVASRSCQ